MLKKLDNGLFGNTSRKIEVVTKILVVVMAIIGLYLLIIGIIGVATFGSYGITDEDVATGISNIIAGFFLIFGGYWMGVVAVGFAKLVRNAEYETFLDEELFEYEDECAACTLESCDECKAKDAEEEIKLETEEEVAKEAIQE